MAGRWRIQIDVRRLESRFRRRARRGASSCLAVSRLAGCFGCSPAHTLARRTTARCASAIPVRCPDGAEESRGRAIECGGTRAGTSNVGCSAVNPGVAGARSGALCE